MRFHVWIADEVREKPPAPTLQTFIDLFRQHQDEFTNDRG